MVAVTVVSISGEVESTALMVALSRISSSCERVIVTIVGRVWVVNVILIIAMCGDCGGGST